MEQRTFNLIDAVCRDGLGNDVWGVADGGNTSDLFGSEANLEINTMFLYVYVDEDAFSLLSTVSMPTSPSEVKTVQ